MLSGWLALWGAPPLSPGAPMAWMTDDPMADHSSAGRTEGTAAPMPGKASQADLDALAHLNGARLAERFLQLMIRHHQGGIAMATYADDHANTDVVRAMTQVALS